MAETAPAPTAGSPWYSHPVYSRYWQHYHQAMAWMRSHRDAYRKAVESYFRPLCHLAPGVQPRSAYDGEAGRPRLRSGRPVVSGDVPCTRLPPDGGRTMGVSVREDQTVSEEEQDGEELASESDGEVECDLSNMEITEELRQYFATTERHREERRRQQQLDAARLDDYVDADHDLYRDTRRSAEPPTERPGERRRAEMELLYGEGAAKIQAMEAALQLAFDRRCDRRLPKYWPVIPLRF
ncbi:gem-associated protein 8 [Lepus europaeus]|uniref:gem-associated protein 8 n=1 Tax=Lepus europaeus TaxID=9983 RepID=UPI002B46E0C9|nr:gem-associated protein 8 [Lepus europaeus]XP_062038962.1 gem-associated protein 8 [Lepus europaeus]XP_062038963.1 gem-associated protein 8 [Lepus europaeus]XP_062038964.1 gem-associated protein 8 [Lepus europaeus]XP_062038965.1 gem-associated protein 8 [Lepus europaeus]XP_062038966.1 gem-associated protein 8 [Lepus europaeus]XP_062038967.1 gem-associated protein 8 [Lepus europaeus]